MTNILDQVIKSQEEEIKASLNIQELVSFLLQDLNSREKEVIKDRNGLEKEKKSTLEAVGKNFNITRERVRQIEKTALNKARKTNDLENKLSNLIDLVSKNLKQHGHLRLEDSLINDLLEDSERPEIDRNRLIFIFKEFLTNIIEPLTIVHTDRAWKLKDKQPHLFEHIVESIKNILSKKEEPLHLDQIIDKLKNEIDEEKINALLEEVESLEHALHSYLEVSKYFKKNIFGKWGLVNWRLVNPKRMRDKIYLVLSKHKQPLHFKKIAEHINQERFDKKIAHPPTIHNELILDDRFVLIGRGIYALVEWGYKPGAISEVIKQILEQKQESMTKEEIIEEVLKHRQVKQGSVNLALLDKDLFNKLDDGRYTLRQAD